MDNKDLDMFKRMLEQALQEVLGRGDTTMEDMASHQAERDIVDQASAESDRAFSLLLRGREQRLIRKIKNALIRIERGEYGICEECGGDISLPRLKARPVTTLCIDCKSLQELGELETYDNGREQRSYTYVQTDPRDARS
ncbi:MAG: DnaK suppressor protein [Desulfovibrionales bacterium]|jgi:DnaK suppressor protein|nr:DnaK suppressor protein [Desulfovibrionales bacterium]